MRTVALLIAGACLLAAADPDPRWRVLNRQALEAIQAKNYTALRTALLELRPLMPGNPRIAYNLAAAEAVLGNRDAALERLRNWAGMGLVHDLKTDSDFASLRDTAGFAAILKQVDENRRAVSHSSPALSLGEADMIPEDIAWDARHNRFLVSSVRKSKIVDGDGNQFAKADWPVLALVIDPRRRLLWATTGWVPHCEHCNAKDKDRTALLGFDLDSGAQKQRIESPVKGLLGDMTISREGDLYVSEGIYGAVFRLEAGAKTLERLDTPGDFPSPQTPALSADEKTLYIPDYMRGIAAMDLSTRRVEWLVPADDIALSGIDGLYVYGDSFLAVQNGTTPPRLMRFSLDLRKQEVLEANSPGLGDPTHGTIVGSQFYFIANSGWNSFDDQGKKLPGAAAAQSFIRRISLPK
jgi:sugar lactone lactonase YvrE